MRKSLLSVLVLLFLYSNAPAMMTTPSLELQGGIMVVPNLGKIFDDTETDSLAFPTARFGGGFNWQARADSTFFFGVNGHINTVYILPYLDTNILVGTHINDNLDFSLKLGADVVIDRGISAIPRLALGLDYKLNKNWSFTTEIATECIIFQSAWLGVRYNFN